jgi:hypothetical protein
MDSAEGRVEGGSPSFQNPERDRDDGGISREIAGICLENDAADAVADRADGSTEVDFIRRFEGVEKPGKTGGHELVGPP